MRLATFLIVLALAGAAPAAARASRAPSDSLAFRPISRVARFVGSAKRGQWTVMDSLARADWQELVRRGTRDSLEVARALDAVVEAGAAAGRARDPQLLALADRAVAIHQRMPGPDSLLLSRSLLARGETRRRRREFEEAESDFARSLAIREHALPADDIEVGDALRFWALLDAIRGRNRAVSEARRALAIAEKYFGPDDMRLASYLSVLGGELNNDGDRLAAYHVLQRSATMAERMLGPDHPDTDRSRYNVALLAMLVGDVAHARTMLERNVEWESTHAPVDSLRLLLSLGALVECLNTFGDHEEALRVDQRVRALGTVLLRPDDPQRAEEHVQRGNAFLGLGRGREAVAEYDSAFVGQMWDTLGATPILFSRAAAWRAAGDTARALETIERASRLAARAGARAPSFDELGLVWGQVLGDAGRFPEALKVLDQAVQVADSVVGPESPMHASLVLERARVRAAVGDPRAWDDAWAGARLRGEHLRAAARGFPERQALLYARDAGLGLDPLLQLAAAGGLDAGRRRQVFERVVESRALVLDEIARREQLARRGGDPGVAARVDSLVDARAELARQLVRAEAGRTADSLRLEARLRAERCELALGEAGGAGRDGAGSPLARLAAGEAIVSYVEYAGAGGRRDGDRRLLAMVARADGRVDVVALGDAAALERGVAAWRADVAGGVSVAAERRVRTSGAALRRLAWDPLAPLLSGVERAWIVPDGPLQLVDFAALPARDGRWLVESGPLLARLGAERDLAAPAGAAETDAAELLAIGGPDFDQRDAATPVSATRGPAVACVRFREVRFGALPGASEEAHDVASRWTAAGRRARVLEGRAADEAAFKRFAPECSALHVATHGFFLGPDCDGGTAGTRGIGGLAPAPAAALAPVAADVAENPLRLAGLAFSGANHRDEAGGADDGVLTAEEIASLDLARVSEVVLSACESGVGDVAAGEGVLGLQRAFRVAGARALVMSLWPVDDHVARDWMRLYWDARLSRHVTVAEAVRAASRARLAALRAAHRPTPPAAWAGFVSQGD